MNQQSVRFTSTHIHQLWQNQTFQSKIRTFFDQSHRQIQNQKIVNYPNQKIESMDSFVEDIENVFKQSNQLYCSNVYLTQQIERIKTTIQKMNGYTNNRVKTQTTTPQKQNLDQSLFFDQEFNNQIVNLRKNNCQLEQKIKSLSFINSFVIDQSNSPKKQEQITQKINASISKIQQSLQTKISQIQLDFTRRIQQIMKTIKHLIGLIEKQQKTIITKNTEVKIRNQNKEKQQKQKHTIKDKKNQSFLNKSQNKISSFFRFNGNSS